MKLFFPVLCILWLSGTCLFGAETDTNAIQNLIDQRAFLDSTNRDVFLQSSRYLSYENKVRLYLRNEMNGGAGFLQNLVPSLGSFIQKDALGGFITLGSIAGGAAIWGLGIALRGVRFSDYNSTEAMAHYNTATTIETIGLFVMAAAYAFNLIIPWTYAGYYNEKLMRGLGIIAEPATGTGMSPYPRNLTMQTKDQNIVSVQLVRFAF